MRLPFVILFGSLIFLTSAVFGQTSSSASVGPNGQLSSSFTYNPRPFSTPAITGVPYSAVEFAQQNQVLTDGTHISRPMTPSTHMYRDSAGRTRTERPFMMAPINTTGEPNFIEIIDPVSGYQYLLDQVNRVAHRSVLPPPFGAASRGLTMGGMGSGTISSGALPNGAIAVPGFPPGTGQHPEFSSESLGTSTIQGVAVEGRLTRVTYPVGMIGNDRPIVSTSESWFSPELKLMILTKTADPRLGETTRGLSDLKREEPDPALFQIPPGYEVVDETGPFTIKITRP